MKALARALPGHVHSLGYLAPGHRAIFPKGIEHLDCAGAQIIRPSSAARPVSKDFHPKLGQRRQSGFSELLARPGGNLPAAAGAIAVGLQAEPFADLGKPPSIEVHPVGDFLIAELAGVESADSGMDMRIAGVQLARLMEVHPLRCLVDHVIGATKSAADFSCWDFLIVAADEGQFSGAPSRLPNQAYQIGAGFDRSMSPAKR